MKKRLFSVIITFLLCFLFLNSIPVFAADWSEAYRDFILWDSFTSSNQFYPDYPIKAALYDMDGNNIPELFIFSGKYEVTGPAYYIYTFSGGSIIPCTPNDSSDNKIILPNCISHFYDTCEFRGLCGCSESALGVDGLYYNLIGNKIYTEKIWHAADSAGLSASIQRSSTIDVGIYNAYLNSCDASYMRSLYITNEIETSKIKSEGWNAFLNNYGYVAASTQNSGYQYTVPVVTPAGAVSVVIDKKPVVFDQPPIIQNGRTLVPLRAIFEALGAEVSWNNDTKTVKATKGNKIIKITIGYNKLYVSGRTVELDVPAQIESGRTLVPVRAISEAFGCNVSWNGDTKTVNIDTSAIEYVPTPVSKDTSEAILIDPGIYVFAPACAPESLLNVVGASVANEANVQIKNSNTSPAQKFSIERVSTKTYRIVAQSSNMALELEGGFTDSGTNVIQSPLTNEESQLWIISKAIGGYYYIRPALNTNLCLSVWNNGAEDGTNVCVNENESKAGQKWKLTKLE
ncbi:MAG: RICIN domain-containing protein [Clostridia bacterium]|nr:RICIN domain-containing protein [Clostridia bacterium]